MTKENQRRFLLLYGSQTGQAKAIAEEIYENAPNHGLQPEIHCLSMTDKKFNLEKETCMVMVVSTTGDGEPPETAAKFWRRLKKKTLPSDHLAHLNYTMLGLGDSNYNNFCRNPKNFDKRLEELSAKKFYPTGFADDAVGLEVVVEPWIDGLWTVLHKHLGITGENSTNGIPETSEKSSCNDEIKNTGEDSIDGNHVKVTSDNTQNGITGSQPSHDENTSSDNQDTRTTTNDNSRTTLPTTRTTAETSSPLITRTETTQESTDNRTSNVIQGSVKAGDSVSEATTDLTHSKGPSLTSSVPPLCESGLTLPLVPPPFLQVQFQLDVKMNIDQYSPQGNAAYPSSKSSVSIATIISATKLTRNDSVKTALDMELDISDSSIDYQPGDAFSIICPNPAAEVDLLIRRLGLSEQADDVFTLQLIANNKKRRAAVPDYIPQPCTPRHALTHCCDIRTPLKKAFLRMLVEYTGSSNEKRRLQELCSKQGASDYGAYIRDASISIVDILMAFPSCNPPLERLLEHLPRLLPRPYSISSSPLVDPKRLHFVFNIIEFPHSRGRCMGRQGVCTGWLNHITQKCQPADKCSGIENDMAGLAIEPRNKVLIFSRTNTYFRLPDDPSTPIIMVGPGTGVAPFVGFLEHREMQLQGAGESGDGALTFGPSWLFFGCRHKERDFLYRDKLQHFVDSGILSKLVDSFSRDDPTDETQPRYVQDNLKVHAADILDLLLEKKAVLYVCGDAKNMAKNVNDTLLELISQHTGKGAYDAVLIVAKLKEEKRYREDIWT